MGNQSWQSKLKADSIGWLLGEDNPSVQYYTQVDILDRDVKSEEVRKAKKAIMEKVWYHKS